VNAHIDFLVIGYFMTATSVGYYAVAVLVARLILLPWEVIREVILTGKGVTDDRKSGSQVTSDLRGYFAYGMAAMIVIAITAAIMFDKVIGVFFSASDQYLASKDEFLFLLPGVILYGATTVYEGVIANSGRAETVGSISFQTLLLKFFLALFLVHAFGINGAALAGTLSFFWYYLAVTETMNDLNMRVNRWGTILYGIVAAGIAVFLVNLMGESLLTAMLSGVLTLLMLVYVGYLDLNVKIGNTTPMDVVGRIRDGVKQAKENTKKTIH